MFSSPASTLGTRSLTGELGQPISAAPPERAREIAYQVEPPLNFIIVDDNDAFRRVLRQIVESHPGWSILAEACDGKGAVELARQLNPDVILMDVVMPIMTGIEATRRIKQQLPSIRIIVLSAFREEEFRIKSLQAGADQFAWKEDLDGAALTRMIRLLSRPDVSPGVK